MLIIAHKGNICGPTNYENTSAAFREAITCPGSVDGIELDVDQTSDGELIVHHRTAEERQKDCNYDLVEVQRRHPKTSLLVDALRDIEQYQTEACRKDIIINIEVKKYTKKNNGAYTNRYEESVLKALAQRELRYVITTTKWGALGAIKKTLNDTDRSLMPSKASLGMILRRTKNKRWTPADMEDCAGKPGLSHLVVRTDIFFTDGVERVLSEAHDAGKHIWLWCGGNYNSWTPKQFVDSVFDDVDKKYSIVHGIITDEAEYAVSKRG